jgi:hypothetical protein
MATSAPLGAFTPRPFRAAHNDEDQYNDEDRLSPGAFGRHPLILIK